MSEAGVAAEEAHDNKLKKHLEDGKEEGPQFVPLAWESTGGATATVHKTLGKWTGLESERGGYQLASSVRTSTPRCPAACSDT